MEGHRGARKMNLFYYRGFVNHKVNVVKRFIFRAPLLRFWPFVISNDFKILQTKETNQLFVKQKTPSTLTDFRLICFHSSSVTNHI